LDRTGTLIDDLLTLSREGREVTDPQPVDLPTINNGCWKTVETDGATLTGTADRSVRADRRRLEQAFENPFRNAVGHGGGDVTVTVGELDDGFYVADDGPGIPPGERDEVFEAGRSESANGTGFGLSIVKQVVTAHNWRLSVTDGATGVRVLPQLSGTIRRESHRRFRGCWRSAPIVLEPEPDVRSHGELIESEVSVFRAPWCFSIDPMATTLESRTSPR
jgi:signal transduction histidine kinase